MKKTKKYVTPEIQLMKIDMAPLLAGSGENTYGGEKGTIYGVDE